VLIVEDVEDDAMLIVDTLQSGGVSFAWHRVETEEELQAAMDRKWDIVFSDFSMPQFNGARALEVLRRHDQDTPFIFVSGISVNSKVHGRHV